MVSITYNQAIEQPRPVPKQEYNQPPSHIS